MGSQNVVLLMEWKKGERGYMALQKGYQTHEKVLQQKANRKHASIESEIAWRVDDGTIFITEKRKMRFQFDKEGRLQIDFDSILSDYSASSYSGR